jgi:DNA-nicking Smr family endonuclease
MGRRRDTPFNNPFAGSAKDLRRMIAQRQEEELRARQAEEAARAAAQAPPPPPGPEEVFAAAMAGVEPLSPAGRVRVASSRAEPAIPVPVDEEVEAYARLADLVEGTGHFDIEDTTEYVEGLAQGVDRRLLRQLKRGDFALQAHFDLHGMIREEARSRVESFLEESRVRGRRTVLLVHGRGLNSKDHIPVLKNALVAWLTRGRLSRRVLAFCTSRPTDGGAGALYVLLRR